MVNSTYRVSKGYHLMLTDRLVWSRKTMGPEEGHARWREQLEKTLKMWHSLACSGSYEKLRMARDQVQEGTPRGEASHQQLLMLIFMGLKSLLRRCWKEHEMRSVSELHMASTTLLALHSKTWIRAMLKMSSLGSMWRSPRQHKQMFREGGKPNTQW